MSEFENLARKLKALAHPVRLRIVALLEEEGEDMYLNQIANSLRINRALAKIHLRKLESASIVKSHVVLVEGEARALRYYKLREFDIKISSKTLRKEAERNGK